MMTELRELYQTLVFVVAVTGVRISEALGLKWGDLDYEHRMFTCSGSRWTGPKLRCR